MASIEIARLAEMALFGKAVAKACENASFPALLLDGPLGAGKTTLVREIVSNLPCAALCEVASPSFNICNIYPAKPRIRHWDLYRCGENFPDELLEALEESSTWNIVEWSGYMPEDCRPRYYLDIHWKLIKNSRLLDVVGHGEKGLACAAEIMTNFFEKRF